MVDELAQAAPGEVAEKAVDFERLVGEEHATRNRPTGPPEVAEQDLHIERKDLGPEAVTVVAKGDPIPAGLAELPRRPARPAPSRKR
jgi:hypothetical protein